MTRGKRPLGQGRWMARKCIHLARIKVPAAVEHCKERSDFIAALTKLYNWKRLPIHTRIHQLWMMLIQTIGSAQVLRSLCTATTFSPRKGNCIACSYE